jgi:signal transduction histidine kinase
VKNLFTNFFAVFLLITPLALLSQSIYFHHDHSGNKNLRSILNKSTSWKKVENNIIEMGFVKNDVVWIKIVGKPTKNNLIVLANAGIDSATFFANEIVYHSGDRVYNPEEDNPFPIFPIIDTIQYIRVKKELSVLKIPIEIKDEKTFLRKQSRYTMINFIALGIFLSFLIYSFSLFLFSRSKVFLFFSFFITNTLIYYFTSNGMLKTIFFPEFLHFSEIRAYSSSFGPLTLFWFNQSLIGYNTSLVNRITKIMWRLILFLILLSLVFYDFLKAHYVQEYLTLVYILCFILTLLLLYMNIRELFTPKQESKRRFAYLFTGSIFIVIALLLIDWSKIEWMPDYDYLLLICCLEIVVFGLFISIDFIGKFKRNEEIAIDSLNSKKRALDELKIIQFKERKNIAAILHNRYQSKLTGFRLNYSNLTNPDEKIIKEMKSLEEEIRNFSHQVLPKELENGLFHDAILRHLDFLKTVYPIWTISYKVFDHDENSKNPWSYDLYLIVSELLQNSLKHSVGREIQIEFFRHEKECILTYADYGQSINSSEFINGFGTSLLKDQVENMGAEIQFELTPNLLIIISIPQ